MTTSKLIGRDPNGTWESPQGETLYKFNITFDNGDKGGIMVKDALGGGLEIGKELTYDVEEKNGYKKIKIVKPNGGGFQKAFNPEAQIKVAVINGITNIIAADKLPIAQMEAAIQKLYNFVKSL